ncbi:unnamed protein product [Spirodela intermedia]|uniref:Prolyl 4-hydroxylase alpha subunit domain-containing protein n=1 Tax=Spirodela intermedia TaxID=51605 RepID=A0A7I8JSD5_SPIIN|nr:unnamed protein product [Spirodela intermedia]CAA6672675.1 unnamed protein product [Spirodela intermedia]
MELKSDEDRKRSFLQANHSTRPGGPDPSKVVQLSAHPRVYLYEGFLSDEECDHLISLARGRLEKSMVVGEIARKPTSGQIRASSGMFLPRGKDEIVKRIEGRISTWTFLPAENGENMQILHYGVNETCEPHSDTSIDPSNLALGGNRAVIVLMYLSNVVHGGEIIFSSSEMKDARVKDGGERSTCGNALLFFNLLPDGAPDKGSFLGGCMVLEGEKWLAAKGIHVKRTATVTATDDNCSSWAAAGECQRNPVFMLGTPDYYGCCRKSCGSC